MKICEKCGEGFPTWMVVDGKRRNLQRRHYCLNCSPFGQHNTINFAATKSPQSLVKRARNVEAVVNWRREAKRKLVLAAGGKCQHCGYDKDVPSAYDFHHVDPLKKLFTISGRTKAFATLQAEAAKCLLLCKNCHAELHDVEHQNTRRQTIERINSPLAQLVEHPAPI